MPDSVDGLTAATLLSDFKARQERWKTTDCSKQVRNLMEKRGCPVEEAVCIGIGSFSRDWEHRHRSLWQLVLFVHVVEQLRTQCPEIKLYAQEPAFTPIDTSFLGLLGFEALGAGIEMHIGMHTFVYAPFVDWHLLLPLFLQGKDPPLYVGNEILDDYTVYAQVEEKKKKVDECNQLGHAFLQHRDMVKLGAFSLHAHALNGMVAYVKKEQEADGGDSKTATR